MFIKFIDRYHLCNIRLSRRTLPNKKAGSVLKKNHVNHTLSMKLDQGSTELN